MCCRYYLEDNAYMKSMAQQAEKTKLFYNHLGTIGKGISSGNIYPDKQVAVLAPDRNGKCKVFPMIWGYKVRGLGKPVINARSETATEKLMFRDSFMVRRCAVPFTHYYEWEHFNSADGKVKTGDRYLIAPKGKEIPFFCGLYRIDDGYPYFVILTKQATDELAFIHDRMPVIIGYEMAENWVNPKFNPHVLLKEARSDMIIEKDAG